LFRPATCTAVAGLVARLPVAPVAPS